MDETEVKESSASKEIRISASQQNACKQGKANVLDRTELCTINKIHACTRKTNVFTS